MKRTILASIVLLCVVALAGCTWQEVEDTSAKFQDGAYKTSEVGTLVAPIFGPYATLAATIAGAVGTIAGAVNTLAKNKKIANLAKTASEAVESLPGGGKALVNAASGYGVAPEIKMAFDSIKKS